MRLLIAGDGPKRAAVEKLLDQGGVRHLAWLAGERTDVPEILRALDLFVLPSLSEGISNTVLEAMASGLPVIATHVGGNAELVEAGLTGELMRSGDVTALRDLMLGYFRDPQRARRHGQAGRERTENQFSLDRMAVEYERLYLRLLQQRGVPHACLNLT
jgi:glycosyltransferase involved in cell wall biosynthesis